MTIQLRLASASDLDSILPLVQAYHEFEGLQMTDDACKTAVSSLLQNPNLGGIWLVLQDTEIAGYIALCTGYSIEFGGQDAFIDEFYLWPKFRGQGVGHQVLELIKIEAKKSGIRALHLEVAQSNLRAKRLYTQAQFEARDKYVLMSVML